MTRVAENRDHGGAATREPHRQHWFFRRLSLAMFVVLASAAVAGFFTTRELVRDQEARRLGDLAAEAGLVVASTFDASADELGLLGDVYAAQPDQPEVAAAVARDMAAGGSSIDIVEQEAGTFVSRVATGTARAGAPIPAEVVPVVRRAVDATDRASQVLPGAGGEPATLVSAVARPSGVVVVQRSPIRPNEPVPTDPDSPFDSLDGALYTSFDADPSQLLFTTTAALPLSGTVHRSQVDVGADRWLLVVKAKTSLVGSFANAMPWIVLAFGLAIAVISSLVVALLVRRRAYALGLVAERTRELRRTFDELETARAAAEAANRSKSEFLSRMSHELRTPLNAVLGFAQLLELDHLTPDQRDGARHIVKAGRHLLELINEILDISRIETGDLSLSCEPVLVREVLGDALDLIRPLAAERAIRVLGAEDASADLYAFADRQRLKQILLNLLSNAVKYNRAGGSVVVACDRVGESQVRVSIADTGPGIGADLLDRLFTPFERLGAEHTEVEGTGVGLVLSRRLADAMGGTLDMESTVGRGSTFWVDLPVAEGPVERYERLGRPEPDASELPAATNSHTVVYIEDNLANFKLVEKVLASRNGVSIIPAMQGRLGIVLAREHRPGVILLDVHLPDIDGLQVLQQLRADPATAAIPVVVISADATHGQVQRLLAAGAAAYVTKPFDIHELLRAIDAALATAARATGSLAP